MYLSLTRPLPRGKGSVSQHFGDHDVAYEGVAGHCGLDYAVPTGTPVFAPTWGRVTVRDDGAVGYGLHVEVRNNTCLVLLGHLSQVSVETGSVVVPGMQVGLSGNSGRSTGPHLHLGLKILGMVNPAYNGWVDPEVFRDI